mmetsp:Transcript_71030/g.205662  ORF Transcript_71030/g.205662 Transcript_71030/m.205662 type:complete len:219 (-) Transcript_71030:1408-2064(-)
MVRSFNTSVITLKFRMSQKPKIASTRRPGIMAFKAELSPPFMFCPMISAPASPNPSASKEPILMIVFSRMTVSIGSGTCCDVRFEKRFIHGNHRSTKLEKRPSLALPFVDRASLSSVFIACRLFRFATCSRWCSSSPMAIASSGLFLMRFNFVIIRSIGVSTKVFASRENVIAPKPSRKQMNNVWNVFSRASKREPPRRSKTKRKLMLSHSASVCWLG